MPRPTALATLRLAVPSLTVGALVLVGLLSASTTIAPPLERPAPARTAPASKPTVPVTPAVDAPLTPVQAMAINAAVPVSRLANPAARPFRMADASPDDRTRALTCLTLAVYYEAYGQGAAGEAAVAQVVLNRLRHPMFPKTVCGVVFDGASLPTGCQFTFTCDGALRRRPDPDGWAEAAKVAQQALDGHVMKTVGEATHYHTIWVVPYWQPSVVKLKQIGAHIFYRWPGGMGVPAAFRGVYAGGEPTPSKLKTQPALRGLFTLVSDPQPVSKPLAAGSEARPPSAPVFLAIRPTSVRISPPPAAVALRAAPVPTPPAAPMAAAPRMAAATLPGASPAIPASAAAGPTGAAGARMVAN